MHRNTGLLAALLVIFSAPSAFAQSAVWDGLARTTFDVAAATLRIPCVVLEDGTGMAIPGFAPAFALNLQLVGDALRLAEPIQAFAEIPESCLDTLVVDGNIAIYSTESAESDSTSAENSNRFYTIELQATIPSDGPIDFAVLTAEDRLYIRPFYEGEIFATRAGIAPYPKEFVYENDLVDEALRRMLLGITVYQAGRLEIQCDFHDPLALLEVVGSVDDNTQYRIKPSLTAADNDKIFSINCTAFDLDINRLELTTPIVEWVISLP
ncbi:MAG: hypothetical protein COB20_01770 [SAR86 cluster bacterium]|uniref:Uncharacterized protein n=1 Tax=SAR86 cluster bacterium TaxID=2030880 RepID=A0A2A4XGX2_9GAMM|nr:MAG: hypothetical protein COB20_01770 [SAR86 cluster bacterium]